MANQPLLTREEEDVAVRQGSDGTSVPGAAKSYIRRKYGKANVEIIDVKRLPERANGGADPIFRVTFDLTHVDSPEGRDD